MENSRGKHLSDLAYKITTGTLQQGDLAEGDAPINVTEASGAEYLYSKYPNEFEYYALAFEVVDSRGNSVEFFSFPVMPEAIRMSKHMLESIKQTMTGKVVNVNPTFPGIDIKLNGNFGRNFKRLQAEVNIGNPRKENIQNGRKENGDSFEVEQYSQDPNFTIGRVFDTDWKTGYGCAKKLEKLLEASAGMDAYNMPYKIFFYNLAFNQALLVEVLDFDFHMSKDMNRIWQYDITLKALGTANSYYKNARYSTQYLIALTKVLQAGNKSAVQGTEALKVKKGGVTILNSKMQKLLNTEVGKRVYQVGTAYTPNVLRTAFQLAENPDNVQYFVPNAGNNILNTGYIF